MWSRHAGLWLRPRPPDGEAEERFQTPRSPHTGQSTLRTMT
nr:MAG TPA: hypothetical protein [Caudoviricetes sp.]